MSSTALGTVAVNDGQSLSINAGTHFSTADAGDHLHFSAVLPAGLSIDATTGVISGTVSEAAFGNLGGSGGASSVTITPGAAEPTNINATAGGAAPVDPSLSGSHASAYNAASVTGQTFTGTTFNVSGDDHKIDGFVGASSGSSNAISGSAWGANVLHVADGLADLSHIQKIDLGYGGHNTIVADGTGNHTLDFTGITVNHATIQAGAGNDTIIGGAGAETFAAGSGADTFVGGSGSNTYVAATGDNGQTDTFIGHGTSNAIVDGAWGANTLHVNDGLTNLQNIQSIDLGYGGHNTIAINGAGDHHVDFTGITLSHATIQAGAGNDVIKGGAGNETFAAGAGADTFIGGTGNNTYVLQSGDNGHTDTIFGHGTSNAVVDSAWGHNVMHVDNGLTNLHNVQSIDLGYGGQNTISVNGTGNHVVDFTGITVSHATIQAGSGNDTIIGGAGNETFATGAGVDTLIGGSGNNTYVLGSGDSHQVDTFIGHGTSNAIVDSAWGTNVMHVADHLTNLSGVTSIDLGYGGHNTILVDDVKTVTVTATDDHGLTASQTLTVDVNGGNHVLDFTGITVNHATIQAGAGNDTITGGNGNETFAAGAGVDTFIGGTGNNTYILQSGDNGQTDTFIGHGTSNSIVDSAWGTNVMHVANHLTNLSGISSIDLGYGGHNTIVDTGTGNHVLDFTGITVNHATLQAGSGNDTIIGGAGNETFGAGSGTDTFVGGSGNNTYVLQSGDNGQTDTFVGHGTSNSIVDSAWGTNVMHVSDHLGNLSGVTSIDLGYGGHNTIIAGGGYDSTSHDGGHGDDDGGRSGDHNGYVMDFTGITVNHATLQAGSGNDTIIGGAGNETFGAGSGTDTFVGGSGNNTYVLQSGDNGQTDTFVGHGTSNSIVDSAWGTNVMHVDNHLANLSGVTSIDLGYGGHNTIIASDGEDHSWNSSGHSDNGDGGYSDDGHSDNNGNDGSGGHDSSSANHVLDFTGITVNHATIQAGAGNDTIIGGAGNETFAAGSGVDTFIGGTGNNTYIAAAGDNGQTDTFIGHGTSNSIVDTAWGSDTLHVSDGLGNLQNIQSIDMGYGGHNTIAGPDSGGTLNFTGMSVSHATIMAGAGDTTIIGPSGSQVLAAGVGNDTLIGGGGGNDLFEFGKGHGNDVVQGGTHGGSWTDTLDLTTEMAAGATITVSVDGQAHTWTQVSDGTHATHQDIHTAQDMGGTVTVHSNTGDETIHFTNIDHIKM